MVVRLSMCQNHLESLFKYIAAPPPTRISDLIGLEWSENLHVYRLLGMLMMLVWGP